MQVDTGYQVSIIPSLAKSNPSARYVESEIASSDQHVSAANARRMARLFNIGNIVALLPGLLVAPVIILGEPQRIAMILMFIAMIVPPILWFGISMVVYTIARHHPNHRVGYYTQQAAYRFYGMFGIIIPVGTFYGNQWQLWIITGGIVGLVIIPWSVWDLVRIRRENWQDIQLQRETS